MSGFDPDYDAVKGMVRALREEEAGVLKRDTYEEWEKCYLYINTSCQL